MKGKLVRSRYFLAAAACAALTCVALLTSGTATGGSLAQVDAVDRYPFDTVPGLGVSADAVVRDDQIAIWESWRRDTYVADCMREQGFRWEPQVLYPQADLVRAAAALGVQPDANSELPTNPAADNRAQAAALGQGGRDAYSRALVGESADDIAYVDAHEGSLPPGATERFASGGCKGDAYDAVGSVWHIKRDLAGPLAELRRDGRSTASFQQYASQYAACAVQYGVPEVSTPMDVDRVAETNPQRLPALGSVSRECSQYWSAADRAGMSALWGRFLSEHGTVIKAQQRTYENAIDTLAADRDFRTFLSGRMSKGEPG